MKGGYKRLHAGAYRELPGVTRGYRWLQEVTGGYKGYEGLQVVTRDDRGLQRIAGGYRALQGNTRV